MYKHETFPSSGKTFRNRSFGSSEVELAVGRKRDGLPAGIRGCVSLVRGKDGGTGGGLGAQELGNLDQMQTMSMSQWSCVQSSWSPLGGSI